MENINWTDIKKWLSDRADCDSEFSDIDIVHRPNKEMIALGFIEDWQNGLFGICEADCIVEVLDILEERPDREEYETQIYSLNRRYFELTKILNK
jgi:hypothetical protein